MFDCDEMFDAVLHTTYDPARHATIFFVTELRKAFSTLVLSLIHAHKEEGVFMGPR